MKIKDRYTGLEAPGGFELADEMSIDRECPECGAEIGQQCSIEDPEKPGMGIEMGAYVHSSRIHP